MNLSGVFAPVPTPFDARGDVDPQRFSRALARWVNSPLTGIVVLGSNGEAALLDEGESDRVIDIARSSVPPDRPLIAGTGRESTRATIDATLRASRLGASAVLVRTPGFFKGQMTSELFVRHYTAVADASPVPVLLYNFTAVTGVTLGVDAVSQLASHPNIIGMKESGGDAARMRELANAAAAGRRNSGERDAGLRSHSERGFALLAGSATTFLSALHEGATGGVLVLSAILPGACVRLFELARAGRRDEAEKLQERLLPISQLVGVKYGVAGVKAALNAAGYDIGDPRAPLAPVSGAVRDTIRETLAAFEEVAA